MCELQRRVRELYFNRLQIHIVRLGLTFFVDCRDRANWQRELLKASETTVLTELTENQVVESIWEYCESVGLDEANIKELLNHVVSCKGI